MRRGRGLAALALAVALPAAIVGAGCGRRQDLGGGAAQDGVRGRGAAEEGREADAAPPYAPPADGRLNDAQMRMYVKVRERESLLREKGSKAADLQAAREATVNPREYLWVRERVLEAEASAATQLLYQKMSAGREQLLARMRRERDAMTDAAERAAAEGRIEDFKRGLQASEPQMSPAVRANVALLARYREPLARLRTLEERALAAGAGIEPPAAPTTSRP